MFYKTFKKALIISWLNKNKKTLRQTCYTKEHKSQYDVTIKW